MYPKQIIDALATVTYAGTKKNLVESEMVADNIRIDGNKVSFSIIFPRDTDPFLKSTLIPCRKRGGGGRHTGI